MNTVGISLGIVVVALGMFMPPIEDTLDGLRIKLPSRKFVVGIGAALIFVSTLSIILES
jgi:hypothetical protein